MFVRDKVQHDDMSSLCRMICRGSEQADGHRLLADVSIATGLSSSRGFLIIFAIRFFAGLSFREFLQSRKVRKITSCKR